MKRAWRHAAVLAMLGLAAAPAPAHDSWLAPARAPAKALLAEERGDAETAAQAWKRAASD